MPESWGKVEIKVIVRDIPGPFHGMTLAINITNTF
jgi:hypothetical protein